MQKENLTAQSAMEIRYSTTKREIFRWYLKRWKHKLWMYHAIIFAVIVFTFHGSHSGAGGFEAKPILIALAYGVGALACMAVFPLLMHKPRERILRIDEQGIKTRIGRQSGEMRWARIVSVQEEPGYIFITGRNQNGFIIPDRAFMDVEAKGAFLAFAKARVR
ncbi:MAG: YcxB family protein [Fibrobacteres bacterium]|nr:YcxB family protein [Fibrobacterota bacterium]